jgi:hypothetical protein
MISVPLAKLLFDAFPLLGENVTKRAQSARATSAKRSGRSASERDPEPQRVMDNPD